MHVASDARHQPAGAVNTSTFRPSDKVSPTTLYSNTHTQDVTGTVEVQGDPKLSKPTRAMEEAGPEPVAECGDCTVAQDRRRALRGFGTVLADAGASRACRCDDLFLW